ncbi:MAG: deoxyribodipyrimidine photo-lyase [Gallionella sp.]|nr:deoxyribodipyrimidine photo-lyase [Gallionella sp.]MDD4959622.1 deoxyribodipyrimidine photo-lyase [Gallionella sp.]
MNPYSTSLCWFRRDLRLHDQAALYHALKNSAAVHCVFVFDTNILDALPNRADRRVAFIWHSVRELQHALQALGSTLHILHGSARTLIPHFAQQLGAQAVFCNHDYEPDAIARDAVVAVALSQQNIAFHDYKDQVIFERDEVLTGAGKPFSVFTPYKNAWLKKLMDADLQPYPTENHFGTLASVNTMNTLPAMLALTKRRFFVGTNLFVHRPKGRKTRSNLPDSRDNSTNKFVPTVKISIADPLPSLTSLGFEELPPSALPCGMSGAEKLFADFQQRIAFYHARRDFPAVKGVSYLSTHLRFGTISLRSLARHAYYTGGEGAQTWLSELIWRDFYQMLLYHHPRVVTQCFKPSFDALVYGNRADHFDTWKNGRTGYPLVDAGMRQLNQTGFMHNRLRMVVASFLVKDLHIDWRWGERYFAEQLLDYDLAANNGGWQWAASTGCDAQPWFRIFNPVTQSEKFDPNGKFIRRYVTELANCPDKFIHAPWKSPTDFAYPAPIVDHAVAREGWLALCRRYLPAQSVTD